MTPSTPPDLDALGREAHALITRLYPLCRSLTGPGIEQTLEILGEILPLEITAVPTGERVFDWTIPDEWTVREAWIAGPDGRRVVDFADHNLHVVGYSTPMHARMPLAELGEHLHSLPDRPDWIPYRTSYYRRTWGFCLAHRQRLALPPGEYEVRVDSSLRPGRLLLAECFVAGQTTDEILIYSHTCHPSLCNDNLSGLAVAALLGRTLLQGGARRYGVRIVLGPATIGSIAWLSRNQRRLSSVRHGLVLASLGDSGCLTYKRSRRENAEVDRIAAYLVGGEFKGRLEEFSPYGYDERQFGSPGIDLPVGRLTRTPNGAYPEYHTSADDLGFVSARQLEGSLRACLAILEAMQSNSACVNLAPQCEPRLGPRNLLRPTGGEGINQFENAVLWVLNQSDGQRDLLSIAEKSRIDFAIIVEAAKALRSAGLLYAPGNFQ